MLTQEEIKNLDAVFTLARQASVGNKQTLVDLINFEASLLNKYSKHHEEKTPVETNTVNPDKPPFPPEKG